MLNILNNTLQDDEDELAPPLPPRRSESLIKSNFYNNGTGQDSPLLDNLPDFLSLQGMYKQIFF